MTEKGKTQQETEFDFSPCLEIMEKMMGEHAEGCDCAEMMSQVTSPGGIPDEWTMVMSQMMEFHCGTPGQTDQGEEKN
jgi:hypothetical protein